MNELGNQLPNRYLWLDGDCTFDPNALADLLLKGNKITEAFFVSEITPEVRKFNRVAPVELGVKTGLKDIHNDWQIPKNYKDEDLRQVIMRKLLVEIERKPQLDGDDVQERLDRSERELLMFEEFGHYPLLRALHYIIDTFIESNTVWGVGRGSSCASYILYLLGVHDVDSVEYELDINEFLR